MKNCRVELRLSAKEKAKMEDIAQKCGLSLSEYLRKRGLGFTPGPFLDDRFFEAYIKLCQISNLPLKPETEAALTAIFREMEKNLFVPCKQTQQEIIEEMIGGPAKPALWGKEDPRSAELLPLAAKEKDGGDLKWLPPDSGR